MARLMIVAVLSLVSLIAGCGTVETAGQRNRRISHIADMQSRMLVDDIDTILLLDQNTRLSRWNSYVGY